MFIMSMSEYCNVTGAAYDYYCYYYYVLSGDNPCQDIRWAASICSIDCGHILFLLTKFFAVISDVHVYVHLYDIVQSDVYICCQLWY